MVLVRLPSLSLVCLLTVAACGTPESNSSLPGAAGPLVELKAKSASISLEEDTSAELDLSVAASSPDVGEIIIVIDRQPAHGKLAAAGARFTYTPNADFYGEDTVAFSGTLGENKSGAATINITVKPKNDLPAFTGTNVSAAEDAGLQTLPFATGISPGPDNETDQGLNFKVTTSNDNLFSNTPTVEPSTGTISFVPAADANGSATLTVSLSDGIDTVTQTFTLTLTAVNDAPRFTKGADRIQLEDAAAQSIALWAGDIAAGPANEVTQNFAFAVTNNNPALFSVQPSLALDGTLAYTVNPDVSGLATVTLTLSDDGGAANGGDNTASDTFTITVNPVNDLPSFTKGADGAVLEDSGAQTVPAWATALSAGPADEAAQTLSFTIVDNDNPALFAVAPAISPAGELTYTPAAHAFGVASIDVSVSDNGGVVSGGVNTSAVQTFVIAVTAVNDAPSFTAGANPTVNEDAGTRTLSGWASSLNKGAANESAQSLIFVIADNTNPSLFSTAPAVNAAGTLSFTPAANAFGAATFSVTLQDDGPLTNGGANTSGSVNVTITVNSVNDAPSFIKGADETRLEDAGAITVNGWATGLSSGPADEAGQSRVFIVSNDNNALFSTQPTVSTAGDLSYTLSADANGSATVSVALRDDGGTANGGGNTSAGQTFSIAVTAVNDPPSFTKGSDHVIDEDAGAQSEIAWATELDAGPGNEVTQSLVFVMVGNTNPGLFSSPPTVSAAGTLFYTAAADAHGAATITLRMQDNGGVAYGGNDTSATVMFDITVDSVNDAPSFTKGADRVVNEDAGAQSYPNWATVNAGPLNEGGQNKVFILSNNTNPALFSLAPTVSATGTLSFTAVANKSGSATITLSLFDDGGTANGGDDRSDDQTFAITVNEVNDAPTQPGITLSPASFDPGNNLYVVVTTPSADADTGDTIRYQYVWSKNSVEQTAYPDTQTTVSNADIAFDDVWSVTVTPTDEIVDGASATASLTIPADPGAWLATGIADVPTARSQASAVWTGSEMIVWGGISGALTNTGGRYNPATDTWVATGTNPSGAPQARYSHTAVWTGREMIVWGGYNAGILLNTGGRYDPGTDSWDGAATATGNAPQGRQYHTAVWTGSNMIVWGGQIDVSGIYANTGASYYPGDNTWHTLAVAGAPVGRSIHTAVWTGKEMIVWGGLTRDGNFDYVATGGRYDPATDSWTATPSSGLTGRGLHAAAWTGSEMIVWGGTYFQTLQTSGARYNPATGAWTAMSETGIPAGIVSHTSVWSGRELILWGGIDTSGEVFNANHQRTGARYNPYTDTWQPTSRTSAPSARREHVAVWTGREMIVWGGGVFTNCCSSYVNTGGRYTPPPATETWIATDTDTAPLARYRHSVVWTGGKMIVWGGGSNAGEFLDNGGVYDPVVDSWTATNTAGAPYPRGNHTAVWTGREMIVWGGGYGDGGRYDPGANSWVALPPVAAAITGQTAVWSGREMILWGGEFPVVNSGQRYLPQLDTWNATSTSGAPEARSHHIAVWSGREMIVWGGRNDSFDPIVSAGGRYDPRADVWYATALTDAPAGRYDTSAVWSGSEMVVWGGFSDFNVGELSGGRYNPQMNAWFPMSTTGAPAASGGQAAVWSGREMIVWGCACETDGISGSRYDPRSDTWTVIPAQAIANYRDQKAVWTGREMMLWGGATFAAGNFVNLGSRYTPPRP